MPCFTLISRGLFTITITVCLTLVSPPLYPLVRLYYREISVLVMFIQWHHSSKLCCRTVQTKYTSLRLFMLQIYAFVLWLITPSLTWYHNYKYRLTLTAYIMANIRHDMLIVNSQVYHQVIHDINWIILQIIMLWIYVLQKLRLARKFIFSSTTSITYQIFTYHLVRQEIVPVK